MIHFHSPSLPHILPHSLNLRVINRLANAPQHLPTGSLHTQARFISLSLSLSLFTHQKISQSRAAAAIIRNARCAILSLKSSRDRPAQINKHARGAQGAGDRGVLLLYRGSLSLPLHKFNILNRSISHRNRVPCLPRGVDVQAQQTYTITRRGEIGIEHTGVYGIVCTERERERKRERSDTRSECSTRESARRGLAFRNFADRLCGRASLLSPYECNLYVYVVR